MISAVFDANILASPRMIWCSRAAGSAGVDYLVTGDRQLQRLGSHLGTTIVSPAQFLEVLASPTEDSVS